MEFLLEFGRRTRRHGEVGQQMCRPAAIRPAVHDVVQQHAADTVTRCQLEVECPDGCPALPHQGATPGACPPRRRRGTCCTPYTPTRAKLSAWLASSTISRT